MRGVAKVAQSAVYEMRCCWGFLLAMDRCRSLCTRPHVCADPCWCKRWGVSVAGSGLEAPVAKKKKKKMMEESTSGVVRAHGMAWNDPYQWMCNVHNPDPDPDFAAYLRQENDYADSFMAALDTEQQQHILLKEMHSRIPAHFSTLAERWGPWHYYQRIPEGKEYPVLCRKMDKKTHILESFIPWKKKHQEEQALLDWNDIAQQYGYVHVGKCRISPDHHYLAYTLDVSGKELFTLHVKDLNTGSDILKRGVTGVVSLAWSKNGKTLFYTVVDELQRPNKVLAWRLNLDKDILIFEESDESFCVDITSTKDCQYITVNSNTRTSSEVYIMDSADTKYRLQKIWARKSGVQCFVEHHHGFFYILTNAPMKDGDDPRENYYLARCGVEDMGLTKWQRITRVEEDFAVEDMDIFDKHVVLFLYRRGKPTICSIPLPLKDIDTNGMKLEDLNPWFLPMPDSSCVVVPGSNHDYMSSVFRAAVSSPVMPEAVVDFNLAEQVFSIVHQEGMNGVHNCVGQSAAFRAVSYFLKSIANSCQINALKCNDRWIDFSEYYCCERKQVVSHDSVEVPLTIVYSRKMRLTGKNPGLIYGYGAYGEVLDKQWCTDRISLLDRGWIIAFADVRGGGGGGNTWHNAGKGLQKPNSIYDFIACSKYLVSEGYVHKDMLAAMGTSAGGLLLGAAVNMCPDLFRAVILKVPFLDICNTLLDPKLPLTILDYEEFGNPENFEEFVTMRSYSPYDNIQQRCYPAALVTASFHDSRVGAWEAAKWVAKVRDYRPPNCRQPLLLKTNMNAGHLGEGGRYQHCKEIAFQYAFLIHIMQMQLNSSSSSFP